MDSKEVHGFEKTIMILKKNHELKQKVHEIQKMFTNTPKLHKFSKSSRIWFYFFDFSWILKKHKFLYFPMDLEKVMNFKKNVDFEQNLQILKRSWIWKKITNSNKISQIWIFFWVFRKVNKFARNVHRHKKESSRIWKKIMNLTTQSWICKKISSNKK